MPRKTTTAQPINDEDIPIERTAPAGTTPRSTQKMLDEDAAEGGLAHVAKAQARNTVPSAAKNTKAATRQPTRETPREIDRDTDRPGAVVVVGRDGERLTRRRISVGDKFDVPKQDIPAGWSYQWNPVSALNAPTDGISVMMAQNGWRPVPSERHPGRWFPPGHTGAIVVDGLRLEERPAALTREALAEDAMRAKTQVRDQTDSLRLTQKQLPGSGEARSRGIAGRVGMKMDIDPSLGIPDTGGYLPADDSIE